MSNLLQEISASQANLETQNGGNASMCGYYAAASIIEAALCAAGAASSCSSYNAMI